MITIKRKIDGMLLATFLTTIFYSSTYPYIHKEVMTNVSDMMTSTSDMMTELSDVRIDNFGVK